MRPDSYEDHYVIRLDEPAIYLAADGTRRDLPEIVEAVDNLDIIPELGSRRWVAQQAIGE